MAILGVSQLRKLWTDRLKIWHTHVIIYVGELTSYAEFHKNRQYGEMYTSRTFFIFFKEISWEALPKKVLNNFNRLMA